MKKEYLYSCCPDFAFLCNDRTSVFSMKAFLAVVRPGMIRHSFGQHTPQSFAVCSKYCA